MGCPWPWIALFASTALAADVSGTWKCDPPITPGCHYSDPTLVLNADGNKLSGQISSWYDCRPRGVPRLQKWTIEDGKIDGDTITFKITYDSGEKKTKLYKGKAKGDQIEFEGANPVTCSGYTLHRVHHPEKRSFGLAVAKPGALPDHRGVAPPFGKY